MKHRFVQVQFSLYLAHLCPSNLFFFSNLKVHLKNKRCENMEYIKRKVTVSDHIKCVLVLSEVLQPMKTC